MKEGQIANEVIKATLGVEPPATMEEAADRLSTLAAVLLLLVEKAAFTTGLISYGRSEHLERDRNSLIRAITESVNEGFISAIKIVDDGSVTHYKDGKLYLTWPNGKTALLFGATTEMIQAYWLGKTAMSFEATTETSQAHWAWQELTWEDLDGRRSAS